MLARRYFSYLLFDPFFYLFPRLRSLVPVLRRQTHIPEKRHISDSLTKVFYPSVLFSPFGTYLFIVALAWCGIGVQYPCRETLGQTENRFRAAKASRVTWSKRRSWENAVHVVETKNKQTWRRSWWTEKVSYFLQRFLYGFKATL